jgi:hypothetical protein
VLQRGTDGEVADAYIWQAEPDYTGNWETLYSGWYEAGRKQTLLRFDLSGLGSATVVRAVLHIYQREGSGSRPVNVHRILASWQEDAVTWASFSGRYERTAVGSFSSAGAGWKQVDITTWVQAWRSGALPNYGVLFDDPSAAAGQFEEYVSSEDGEAELRPKLELCLGGG